MKTSKISSIEMDSNPNQRPKMAANHERHKSIANQLAERSSHFAEMDFHGMADFIKSMAIVMKVFWALVMIAATGFAIYISYLLISNSSSSQTVSKIEFKSPESLEYPTITICDKLGSMFLSRSKLNADRISTATVNLMLLSGPIWALAYSSIPNETILSDSEAVDFHKNLLAKHNGDPSEALRQFFLKYSSTCKDIFWKCRDADYTELDCCLMFRRIFHTSKGICFATDPSRMPKMNAPGLFSNLFIKLRMPVDLYSYSNTPTDFTYEIAIDSGVAQGMWRADTIQLPLGNWATARLAVKQVDMEPSDATPCAEDPELEYFHNFTFSNCMWEKRLFNNEKFEISKLCRLPILNLLKFGNIHIPAGNSSISAANHHQKLNSEGKHMEKANSNSEELCSPKIIFDNIYKPINTSTVSLGLLTGISFWMFRLSMSKANPCQLPCKRWEYGYTVEQNDEFPDRKFAGITLTLSDLQYQFIRELKPLEWYDYIALIGGAWGLCVGASVVTIVQLAVYSLKFCLHKRFPGGAE